MAVTAARYPQSMGVREAQTLGRTWEQTLLIVRRTVEQLCRRWPAEARDDILQDAMVRVLQAADRRDPDALPRAYLQRVVYSAMIDEVRRRRRRNETSLEDDASADPDVAARLDRSRRGPEEAAILAKVGDSIFECIRRLKPDRRAALLLHLRGYSAAESANLLGCNVKKVRNLICRGKADLRTCLEQRGLHGPEVVDLTRSALPSDAHDGGHRALRARCVSA